MKKFYSVNSTIHKEYLLFGIVLNVSSTLLKTNQKYFMSGEYRKTRRDATNVYFYLHCFNLMIKVSFRTEKIVTLI